MSVHGLTGPADAEMVCDPGQMRYGTVVLGGSAGSLNALIDLMPRLPGDFPWPIVAVVHLHPRQEGDFAELLDRHCSLKVKEAEDKETILPGHVYFAPPNYHLLLEPDRTLSLSADEAVNFSRPSIDVLFESAADSCRAALIGIVLTGSSDDGARGLARIREFGGLAVVQDPAQAEHSLMPEAAVQLARPEFVLPLCEIANLLNTLAGCPSGHCGPHNAREPKG